MRYFELNLLRLYDLLYKDSLGKKKNGRINIKGRKFGLIVQGCLIFRIIGRISHLLMNLIG